MKKYTKCVLYDDIIAELLYETRYTYFIYLKNVICGYVPIEDCIIVII